MAHKTSKQSAPENVSNGYFCVPEKSIPGNHYIAASPAST